MTPLHSVCSGLLIGSTIALPIAVQPVLSRPAIAASLSSAALFKRAGEKVVQRDYEGALVDYTEVIKLDPGNWRSYQNRAEIYQELYLLQRAIADYTQAIRLRPDYTQAYIRRANSQQTIGDLQGALSDYTQAIKLEPQNNQAYRGRANVRSQLGDKQGAAADYDQLVKIVPRGIGYLERGDFRYLQNDLRGAIADYTIAAQQFPNRATLPLLYYVHLGSALYRLGDRQAAIALYTQLIDSKQDNESVGIGYYLRGFVRHDLGDYRGAIADYKAVEFGPDKAAVEEAKLLAAYKLGDAEAIAELNRYNTYPFRLASLYESRSDDRLYWMQDPDGAIRDLNQAIAVLPTGSWLTGRNYGSRAKIRRNYLNDKRGAIADYTEALRLEPKFSSHYVSRGEIWAELKEYAKAIADYTQAIELGPSDQAYLGRAKAYAAQGNKQAAIADYQKLLIAYQQQGNTKLVQEMQEAIKKLRR